MLRSLVASIALLAAAAMAAGSGQVAAGVNFGQSSTNGYSGPFTGLNFRMGLDESLDLIGVYDGDNGGMILNGNYLHHVSPILPQVPIKGIVPYAGIGVGLWMGNSSGTWLQVPLGLDFRFKIPLEVGFFLAPGVNLVPNTQFNMHYGIGLRYWL